MLVVGGEIAEDYLRDAKLFKLYQFYFIGDFIFNFYFKYCTWHLFMSL